MCMWRTRPYTYTSALVRLATCGREGPCCVRRIRRASMRIIRATSVVALLVGALLVTSLSSAKDAHAFAVHFCGSVQFPGTECYHPTQSHWDRVRSRYPGPQAHNVYSC